MSFKTEMLAIAAVFSVGIGLAQPAAADNHLTMPVDEAATEDVMTEPDVVGQVDEESEPVVVDGTVVDIVGDQVRVRDADTEETTFYDIPRDQQIEAGLEEGDVIELVLVDDEVVAITGPSGRSIELVDLDEPTDETIVEETVTIEEETVTTETEETVVEQPTPTVQQPAPVVETTETPEPVRALW